MNPRRLSLKKNFEKKWMCHDVSGHFFEILVEKDFCPTAPGLYPVVQFLDEDVSSVNYAYAQKYRT